MGNNCNNGSSFNKYLAELKKLTYADLKKTCLERIVHRYILITIITL